MKKITLISLIIFAIIAGSIYLYGLIFNPPTAKPPIVDNNTSPQAQTNQSNPPAFSLTEVAKHSSPNDCYLIINNNVYDVSSFVDSHPGGRQKIISNCGAEVTGIFTGIHSNQAWDLLAKYKVGTLAK